jgi:hypothetical protein
VLHISFESLDRYRARPIYEKAAHATWVRAGTIARVATRSPGPGDPHDRGVATVLCPASAQLGHVVAISRTGVAQSGLRQCRAGSFCVVAICEDGKVRAAGRVPSKPDGLGLLAESLLRTDRVALEVTGSCWEVARILEPFVQLVVVVSLR